MLLPSFRDGFDWLTQALVTSSQIIHTPIDSKALFSASALSDHLHSPFLPPAIPLAVKSPCEYLQLCGEVLIEADRTSLLQISIHGSRREETIQRRSLVNGLNTGRFRKGFVCLGQESSGLTEKVTNSWELQSHRTRP